MMPFFSFQHRQDVTTSACAGENKLLCILCYLEDKKIFIFHNGNYSVANATRHLKLKHPCQHSEYLIAINRAKPVADLSPSPPAKSNENENCSSNDAQQFYHFARNYFPYSVAVIVFTKLHAKKCIRSYSSE